MKKSSITHPVAVGFFISIGVLLLVIAIFFLGGQQKTFTKTITVKAVFDDINGLQAGNNVWLFGVKIGMVKKVNFYGQAKVEVIMSLEKEAQSRIHKDATAKVSSDGFIGNKIIVLSGGSVNEPAVADGDYVNVSVVQGAEQMLATLQESNKNLLEITGNIKAVSKKLLSGEGSLGQLLNDPTMAQNLKAAMQHFKNVSEKSESVMANVQQFSEGLHQPGTLANELVSDTVVFSTIRSTVFNLKATVGNLNNTSLKIESITDSLQKLSAGLNDTHKPVGMLLNDEQVAQNLRMMIKNLESGSKKLDDDLEAAQHNFLLRGFFRKREKEKKP